MATRIDMRLVYAFTIQFLATGIIVLTLPYATSLFLSTYPSSWLPYLYLAEGAVTAILLFPQHILFRHIRNFQIYLSLTFIALIVIGYYALSKKISGAPFLFVLLLEVISLLTNGMAWLVTTLAFEVRTFRRIGRWLSVSGTVGGIIFSIPVMLVSKIDINLIVVLIIMLLILLSIPLTKLKPLAAGHKPATIVTDQQEKKIGINLFYVVIAFSVISTIIHTFADYNLRSQLAIIYDKNGIAIFLAGFLGIANIATLFSEIVGTKRLIESYGVISLLVIMPLFALIFATVGVFIPNLWTAAILMAGIYTCHYSYNSLGREIILNVLPPATKRSWLFQTKFILRPVGTLLGGLFAWSLGTDATMRKICIAIIITSLVLLMLLYLIKRNYLTTLKKFLNEKYFNIVAVYGIKPAIKKEFALQAIRTLGIIPDIIAKLSTKQTHYVAMNALLKLGDKAIPALVKLTQNNSPLAVQVRAIQILASINSATAEHELTQLTHAENTYIATIASKFLAYRSQQFSVQQALKKSAKENVLKEAAYVKLLTKTLAALTENSLILEITSRRELAKMRYLYWLAIHALPQNIFPALSVLLAKNSGIQNQANVMEYLDNSLKDKELSKTLVTVFEVTTVKDSNKDLTELTANDLWLKNFLLYQQNKLTGENMAIVETVIGLRSVDLFSSLPAEILLEIAKVVETKKIAKGETLFLQNDAPTGMYIITAGKVEMIRDKQVIDSLSEGKWFGELALLDDFPRAATAVAVTDATLLYISKTAFEHITDEFSEVLKGIMQVVMRYLRKYMKDGLLDELKEK